MLQVSNKDNITMYFTSFSSASIVDFEQENISCVVH